MLKKNFPSRFIFALCAILSFFTSTDSFAQGESSNWYFGRNAGINFNDDTVRPLETGAIQTNEGCASISNSDGELLFYTDGIFVWDRNHNVMPNGSGLLGNKSSTQSAVIVPKPNSDSIYYIFTVTNLANTQGVKYSEVDMTLNGGNGDLTFNKNITLTGRSTEKISAVKHANGTDYWIATHTWNSNEFSVFKITETGVETTPVNSAIGSFHGGLRFNSIGYMKFSPNGKRLALAKWSTDSSVEIFDFDSNTGIISNPIIIDNFFARNYENGAYGIEFSPNSNMLYVTELDLTTYESKLHQFDLSVYNRLAIITSDSIIYRGRDVLAAIQLASNGKIYVCNAFSRHLNVIQNPNLKGVSCDYLKRSTSLGTNSAVYGLPTFIQSLFVANIEVDNACLSGETQFSIQTDERIDTISWDFGDSQISNQITPSHNYLSTGEYIVKAKIKSGNSIINLTRKVIIYESPIAYKATNYVICEDNASDGFETFELTTKDIEVLGGQSEIDYEVSYFESLVDAETNDNVLGIQTINKKNYQEIFARVSNRLSGECYSISSFLLVVETEIAGDVKDFMLCVDQFNASGIPVDLNQFDDEVYTSNIVTPHADYVITYYLSQPAADGGIGELVPNTFEVTTHRTTIYARLENIEAGCYTTSNFDIIINETFAHKPTDLYLCDDDSNDGKELFDLASQKSGVLNGATGKVTFHTSQVDADSGAQPLADNFENQSNSQEIFVRVENSKNASCFDTTSFFIEVIFQPIAGTVEDYVICDDASNDGKENIDLAQFDAAVYNGQSTADYTVTYHKSASDANSGTNELPDNFNSSSQEIYTRIENSVSTSSGQTIVCYKTSKFNVVIDEIITANRPLDLYLCDDDSNDGKELFDLASQKSDILNGATGKVTFHTSQVDADSGAQPLADNFENQSNSQEIFVRVENSKNASCFDTTSFFIEVIFQPIAGTVEDYVICDDASNDGKENIDLAQFDAAVYNGQSTTDYSVTYHKSASDANAGTNELPDNFNSSSQEIYTRIENAISTSSGQTIVCYTTSKFNVVIDEFITANRPLDLYLCDDDSNDGKELFDLASQKTDILNGATGRVTFHTSQVDADSGAQPLADNFENQSTSQEIFVRVENLKNASCFDTTSFFIEVIFQPNAGAVEDYVICDDASNDGKENIDLAQFDAAVYNGQSTTDYSVTYHKSASDANSGTNELPDNFNSSSQEIYTRIENSVSTSDGQTIVCFTTSKFNVVIDKFITANRPSDLYLCDDDSNDGKELFDLGSQKSDILNGATGKVTFHASQSDADSGASPIAENFKNQSISQEIFVRVENLKNASCFDTTSFFIEVIFQPIAGTVEDYVICDDASNDGKETIDLNQFDVAVFNGQSTADYTVTYHKSASEANSGTNQLPDNFNSSSQEIHTRIENTVNTSGGQTIVCFTTSKFNVVIDKFITANRPPDLYLCDDASNDGKELFDLRVQKLDVLNGETGKVTFYASQVDADLGEQPLADIFENQSISQEIFVRVENLKNASCFDTTSFFIEVTSQATAGNIDDYIICDDQSNDGKEFIDLSQFDSAVYNGLSTTDYTVTYHETEADADIGNNALPDNYETTSQELFARIENAKSESRGVVCYGITKFNVVINQALTAHQPSDIYMCDDVSNDGKELFDLASKKADILKGQTGKVTFHVSQLDADSGTQALNENFENQSIRQEIFVRVENLVNANCYDTTSFYIEVNSKPVIDIIKTWYLCPGEDLQLYVNSIHDAYLWSNGETDSEIIIDGAGTYSVTVYNIIEGLSECSVTETIQVLETELPTSVEIITVDWTTTNNSIEVNVNGTENYLFSIDGDVYQSSNTFNDLEAGDYIVYVKNERDCLLHLEDVYLLNYPKFFTPNNDGYNDYWKINFSEKEPQTEIHIFDRYGKLITRLSAQSQGWDGTLNGQLLTTSDYWFVVNRPSKNKKYKGHFTLKR